MVGTEQRLRLPNSTKKQQTYEACQMRNLQRRRLQCYKQSNRHTDDNGEHILWQRQKRKEKLAQKVRKKYKDKINIRKFDITSVDVCEKPNTAILLYVRHVCLLCLCLVEFSCTQVSCKIRNSRTWEDYCGTHQVYYIVYTIYYILYSIYYILYII